MPDVIPQGARYDIEIFQGGTYQRSFALRRRDQVTPVPLTGYTTGRAQMRTKEGGDLLAEFDVEVHDTSDVDDPDCGKVDISMAAEVTTELVRSGWWDLVLIHESGDDIVYLIEGFAVLNKRVTVVA